MAGWASLCVASFVWWYGYRQWWCMARCESASAMLYAFANAISHLQASPFLPSNFRFHALPVKGGS